MAEEIQQIGADAQSHKDKWMAQIRNAAAATSETTPKPIIQKIPQMLLSQDTKDYEKYYVPRVVSLGPYHHGKEKLQFIENLKPIITNKFVNDNMGTLGGLYDNLYRQIEKVRSCYEENSIAGDISDHELTVMMVQDGCFILHYIYRTMNDTGEKKEDFGLRRHHIAFIQQDIFLLENQVPYFVLVELMMSRKEVKWQIEVDHFISSNNIMASDWLRKKYSFSNCFIAGSAKEREGMSNNIEPAHLLELLHMRLVGVNPPAETKIGNEYTFRSVNELLNVGIHFKPSKSSCLADIKYYSRGYYAVVELPAITVDDATRPTLLNLVAYEMCADVSDKSWVTSYICFLESLIERAEDVKELRKAGVLKNRLGSDEEVAKLFGEIGKDLVPNPCAYADAKCRIQKHYVNRGKTFITQLLWCGAGSCSY